MSCKTKMSLKILIVDLVGELIKDLGLFSENEIEKLIDMTHKLNLNCLQSIDLVGDTYFSEKQLLEIRREMDILKTTNTVSLELLDTIERGIIIALEEGFLKFESSKY